MTPPRTSIVLVLISMLTAADCYAGLNVVRRSVQRPVVKSPIVMRKVDDTKRAAEAEAARIAEEDRIAAAAAADPEPGPCPECGDESTYWDGMITFACTNCGHEWGMEEEQAAAEEFITRDSTGVELSNHDSVVLTKDLAGGKLKKGTKVKVRLGDFADNHNLEATIPSMGKYFLKSEFVKKTAK